MANIAKEMIDKLEKIKIGADETFTFHCDNCGKCCLYRDDLLLNPCDVFRISKHLNVSPKDFIKEYCECYIGDDSALPLVRILPKGSIRRCPFLKERKCQIHEVKPSVCAMFPIGRFTQAENGKVNENAEIGFILDPPECGDASETHTVREWLARFNIPVKDEYFLTWRSVVLELSPALRKIRETFTSEVLKKLYLISFITLYMDYDLNDDFLTQFKANSQELLDIVQ